MRVRLQVINTAAYVPGGLHCVFVCALQDLYVGCKLTVFKRMFELLDADEYTLSYMDNNKHIFIMADADAILASLRGQVRNRAEVEAVVAIAKGSRLHAEKSDTARVSLT